MPEFTIHIDTHPGTVFGEDYLEIVAEALDKGPALGAAVSLDTKTGVLGATFQVEVAEMADAGKVGVEAFKEALHAAAIWGASGSVKTKSVGEPFVDRLTIVQVDDHEVVSAQ